MLNNNRVAKQIKSQSIEQKHPNVLKTKIFLNNKYSSFKI